MKDYSELIKKGYEVMGMAHEAGAEVESEVIFRVTKALEEFDKFSRGLMTWCWNMDVLPVLKCAKMGSGIKPCGKCLNCAYAKLYELEIPDRKKKK